MAITRVVSPHGRLGRVQVGRVGDFLRLRWGETGDSRVTGLPMAPEAPPERSLPSGASPEGSGTVGIMTSGGDARPRRLRGLPEANLGNLTRNLQSWPSGVGILP